MMLLQHAMCLSYTWMGRRLGRAAELSHSFEILLCLSGEFDVSSRGISEGNCRRPGELGSLASILPTPRSARDSPRSILKTL